MLDYDEIDSVMIFWLILVLAQVSMPTAAHSRTAVTIVALGDSTTAGAPFYLSPVEAPPNGEGDAQAPYPAQLQKRHRNWIIRNAGINGQRTDQFLTRFDRDVRQVHPRVVIILGGVNDIYQGRPLDAIEADLRELYLQALAHHIIPIAASALPFNAATPDQSQAIRRLNNWIQSYARDHQIAFCDTHAAVAAPGHPDQLRGSPDGLHPDRDGYAAMGQAVDRTLDQLNLER
jgi:lysophospholipase L1-like esterase